MADNSSSHDLQVQGNETVYQSAIDVSSNQNNFEIEANQNFSSFIQAEGDNGTSTDEEADIGIFVDIGNKNEARNIQTVPTSITSFSSAITRSAITLTPGFSTQQLKPSDIDDNQMVTNYPIFEYDIDRGEKPWRKPGSDVSDYFNYGFNEETWRVYCEKQRRLRIEAASTRRVLAENPSNIIEPKPVETPQFPEPQFQYQQPPTPQAPVNIPLPPGLNLNITPELSNTIANLAVSALGLPQNFLSNLPSFSHLLTPGMTSTVHDLSSFPTTSSYQSTAVVIPDQNSPDKPKDEITDISKRSNNQVSTPTKSKSSRERRRRTRSPPRRSRSRSRGKGRMISKSSKRDDRRR